MESATMGVLFFSGSVVLLSVLIHLLRRPLFLLLRLIVQTSFGTAILIFINTFCGGFYVGINPVTMLISGVLGLPGILAMVLLRLL